MRNIYKVLAIFLLACLPSCKTSEQEDIEKITIDFFSKLGDFSELNVQYENVLIALSESTDEEAPLKQIDKIVIKDSIIYIADTYMKNLFLYDMEGNRLGKVGEKGEGPDEYLSLSDFCLSGDGKIYWYDGVKNRVQVYANDLSLLEQYKIPFKAECIQSMGNSFLFSLAPYNVESLTQKKCLVYTDTGFKPIKTILQYDDNIDLNVEFYSPFIASGNAVIYNRVINNNVYVISDKGIEQCYYFDFGSDNIDNESLRDLNKLMESEKKCCYLALPPIFLQDFFIGCLNKDGDIYTFVHDTKEHKSYMKKMSNFNPESVNLPISLSDDNRVVSYMNKDIYPDFENDKALSDKVKRTIDEGGFVICISKLKR